MALTPEKIAALDATAEERAPLLDQKHVTNGAQPYHAGALTPDEHVPGNVKLIESPTQQKAAEFGATYHEPFAVSDLLTNDYIHSSLAVEKKEEANG